MSHDIPLSNSMDKNDENTINAYLCAVLDGVEKKQLSENNDSNVSN